MALTNSRIIVFDVLVFLAILLLVLALVPPFVFKNAARRKTWSTLMLSMLIFSVGEALLVGRQTGVPPNAAICLIQAAVNYATPPFCAAAMISYTANIYISICRMFTFATWEGPEPNNTVVLVLLPWIIFFLILLEALFVIGMPRSTAVRTSPNPELPGLYCHTNRLAPLLVSAIAVVLAGLVVIGFQTATGRVLYKNWIKVKNLSVRSTIYRYIDAFIRSLAFMVVAILGTALGLVATSTPGETHFGYAILLPLLPIASALIFGTYKDILSFYFFWR
ncbi:hypothetical protein P691DRAFT_803370 [Macrolepiota fuliginosa MF-IS2]|uniref:Uncharacterized protein n=1 Tax=Macrolepiota fuliginosa MF-IS2 TaxID=1400762 RepID=A0A9P5X8J9_9AGAR|nr:hypothetical protein P691DRAFT_803370 [Macrolepiota fuliginosa MF-IS2]